jgi:hypothetical protein
LTTAGTVTLTVNAPYGTANGIQIPVLSSDPSSPSSFQIWGNSALDQYRLNDPRTSGTVSLVVPVVTVSPNGPDLHGNYGPNSSGTTTGGIQEAINSLTNGGIVQIKQGTYTISTAIAPASYTSIQGENAEKTVITQSSNTHTVAIPENSEQISLDKITLKNGNSGMYCLQVLDSSFIFSKTVRLYPSNGAIGCNIQGVSDGAYFNHFQDWDIYGDSNSHSIGIYSQDNGQTIGNSQFDNIRFKNLNIGLKEDGAKENLFNNANFVNCTTAVSSGASMSTFNEVFVKPYFESCTTAIAYGTSSTNLHVYSPRTSNVTHNWTGTIPSGAIWLDNTGVFLIYNGLQVYGQGIVPIIASNSLSGQTAGVTITSATVGASAGNFEIGGNLIITTSNSESISFNYAWKDATGARNQNAMMLADNGNAFTQTATGAHEFSLPSFSINSVAGGTITLSTGGSYGASTVYTIEGWIKQIV